MGISFFLFLAQPLFKLRPQSKGKAGAGEFKAVVF
jgi:hypothetical protein